MKFFLKYRFVLLTAIIFAHCMLFFLSHPVLCTTERSGYLLLKNIVHAYRSYSPVPPSCWSFMSGGDHTFFSIYQNETKLGVMTWKNPLFDHNFFTSLNSRKDSMVLSVFLLNKKFYDDSKDGNFICDGLSIKKGSYYIFPESFEKNFSDIQAVLEKTHRSTFQDSPVVRLVCP